MDTPKKPFWLKPREAIMPSLLLALSAACLVLASLSWGSKDVPAGTPVMVALVGGLFCTFSVLWCYTRYRAWKRWTYISFDGVALMVDPGGWQLFRSLTGLEGYRAFKDWWPVYGKSRVDGVMGRGVIWVRFEELPINVNGRSVNGYVTFHTREIVVGYQTPEQSVYNTSLRHELGHLIQGEIDGWDEDRHHRFAQHHGLS